MTGDCRRVPADGAIVAYCQLAMLKALAGGTPAAEASDAGFALFGILARMTAGRQVAEPARRVATPVNCLSQSAAAVRDAFGQSWAENIIRHKGRITGIDLDEDTIDAMIWLLDAVERISHGVAPLDAARQAYDKSRGKPRQRRKPAAPEWLTGIIDAVLASLWTALREQRPYGRPLPAVPPAVPEGR